MRARALLARPAVLRCLLLLQLAVVPAGLLVLFYLLVERLPLVELRAAAAVVAASFVFALFGYGLFALRLAYMLEAFSIPLTRYEIWRIHLTSLFYYFFLPAGAGYDFSKFTKIALSAPRERGRHVSAAVIGERVIGGAGMYLLLLGTLPFARPRPESRLDWLIPSVPGWMLLIALIPVACWLAHRIGRRSGAYRSTPLVPAVLVSVASYLLVAGAIWFVARSLGIQIAFPEVVVALAATLLLQLVPVNVLGVTLGEVAAVTVYLAYGLDRPEALLLVTVAYSHRLVAAILGGMVELSGTLRALRRPGTAATGRRDAR